MKLMVKQAVQNDRTNFDVSSKHITTADFGTIQPSYFLECVPNDHLNFSMREFARLSPLPVPTFGNIRVHARAFFVPMRAIYIGFKDYISRSNDASLATTLPQITNVELQNWFTDTSLSITVVDTDSYDFQIDSSSYRFTSKGRWLYKILLSLGYSINFGYSSLSAAGGDAAKIDQTSFSALPILAFMRVLYDYIYPSDYVNGIGLGSLFEDRSQITSSNILAKLKPLLFAPFRQDYFTSAWKNLNRHGDSDNVSMSITDPMSTSGNIVSSDIRTAAPVTSNKFSSMGLRILDAVTNYVTRNNIAGSRYFEQLRARFGISSPNADPDRSMFVKAFTDDVTIQDVTSLSATQGAELGELAGKGYVVQGDGVSHTLEFDVDSFGYFIVLSHIEPDTFYFQGRKRHTLHIDPLDFYTPEFDSIGLQPIRHDELYAVSKNYSEYRSNIAPNGVFGFAPRYAEYKKNDDYLTGDFRVNSANSGLDSYHLGRIVTGNTILDADFCAIKQHEFDRIFTNPAQQIAPYSWKTIAWTYQGESVSYQFEETVLCYDSKPILLFSKFHGHTGHAGCGCIILGSDGQMHVQIIHDYDSRASKLFVTGYLNSHSNECFFVYLKDSDDNTGATDCIIGGTSSSTNAGIVLSGRKFCFSLDPTNNPEWVFVTSTFTWSCVFFYNWPADAQGARLCTPEIFFDFWLQYFDHFIFYYNFSVTAGRKMLSISESLPVEDGSSPVSVDAYGTHLNT